MQPSEVPPGATAGPTNGAGSTLPDSVTGLARRERVRAFDLARGLAVLFMIFVHVLWHWGAPATWSSPIGYVISFLGGPTAAPTFMFLMGASLAFSSRSDFGSLAARGAWLVFLGYLLNVLRGVIPAEIGLRTGFVTAEQIAPFDAWWLLTTVDIHHMAGLSLIAIAALRVRSKPGWLWLALAGALALASPSLRAIDTGSPLLNSVLAPILGTAPNVYYAVVPWLVYPLTGAVFGAVMARASDRQRVFRWAGLLGLALCVAGAGLLALERPAFDVVTYWREPISFIVGISGIGLVWLAICDVATRQAWLDRRLGIVYGWSARVIPMYFVHWIVVGWGIGATGFRALSLPAVLIAMVVAVAVTSYASRLAIPLESPPWRWRRDSRSSRPEAIADAT